MLNKIAPDKWKHFFVGLAMGLVFQALAGYFFPAELVFSTITVLFLVAAISYGFELYSKFTGHGHYEIMDAIAAITGGVLGMLIIILLQIM
jgi:VanZ family protein